MRVGIIAAMAEEAKLLKEQLEDSKTTTVSRWHFCEGKLFGQSVIVVESGIGKVMAAVVATILLETFKADLLVNTGSAGGIGSHLKVGDVVIASKLAYSDVDVTAFNYDYGQMAQMPLYYVTSPELIAPLDLAAQTVGLTTHLGLITSSDSFINTENQRQDIITHFPTVLAAEMEGAAIAQVAFAFQRPFVVVRAISDIAGRGNNEVSFETFITEAGNRSAKMVLSFLKQLTD